MREGDEESNCINCFFSRQVGYVSFHCSIVMNCWHQHPQPLLVKDKTGPARRGW